MKPFDLEAAKRGEPVICRDGRKARILCFDMITDEMYCLPALILDPINNKEIFRWFNLEGKFLAVDPHDSDLFMDPKVKNFYLNIYRDGPNGIPYTANTFRTLSEASTAAKDIKNFIKTISFEVEEI